MITPRAIRCTGGVLAALFMWYMNQPLMSSFFSHWVSFSSLTRRDVCLCLILFYFSVIVETFDRSWLHRLVPWLLSNWRANQETMLWGRIPVGRPSFSRLGMRMSAPHPVRKYSSLLSVLPWKNWVLTNVIVMFLCSGLSDNSPALCAGHGFGELGRYALNLGAVGGFTVAWITSDHTVPVKEMHVPFFAFSSTPCRHFWYLFLLKVG